MVFAAASGATASLMLSLENGKVERFEFFRAAVAAGVVALAFAQSPRETLPPRHNRDDG